MRFRSSACSRSPLRKWRACGDVTRLSNAVKGLQVHLVWLFDLHRLAPLGWRSGRKGVSPRFLRSIQHKDRIGVDGLAVLIAHILFSSVVPEILSALIAEPATLPCSMKYATRSLTPQEASDHLTGLNPLVACIMSALSKSAGASVQAANSIAPSAGASANGGTGKMRTEPRASSKRPSADQMNVAEIGCDDC